MNPPGDREVSLSTARRYLGVDDTSTSAEIRAAFRLAARDGHPDTGDGTIDAATLRAARDRCLRAVGHPSPWPPGRQRVFVRRRRRLRSMSRLIGRTVRRSHSRPGRVAHRKVL